MLSYEPGGRSFVARWPGWDSAMMPADGESFAFPRIAEAFWDELRVELDDDGRARGELRFPWPLEWLARVALGGGALLGLTTSQEPWKTSVVFAGIQIGVSLVAFAMLLATRSQIRRALAERPPHGSGSYSP